MCRFDFYRGYAAATDPFRSLWASLRFIRRAPGYLVDTVGIIVSGVPKFLSFVIIRAPRTTLNACRSAFGYICWLRNHLNELHDGPPSPVYPNNGRTHNNADLFVVKEQLKTVLGMIQTESAQTERLATDIKGLAETLEWLNRTHDGTATGQTAGSTTSATPPPL